MRFLNNYLFISYFIFLLFLVLVAGFSLVVASGGYSLGAVRGLFIAVASLMEHGL